jgi:peptide deformylase
VIREILRMGDPRLLQKAQPVATFGTPELAALLADMRDTMSHHNGAGLAAPQIGVGLRVVIFGVRANPRYPHAEEVPDTVLINPAWSRGSTRASCSTSATTSMACSTRCASATCASSASTRRCFRAKTCRRRSDG